MNSSISFGLAFAVIISALLKLIERQTAILVLAIQLGAIYGAYLGFCLSVEEKERVSKTDQKNAWSLFDQQTSIEMIFVMVSIVIGVQSVQRQSAAIMSLGYILHGVWDFIHHFTFDKVKVPRWYIPFCSIFDITLGILIYFIL